jgi:hypothetical protein
MNIRVVIQRDRRISKLDEINNAKDLESALRVRKLSNFGRAGKVVSKLIGLLEHGQIEAEQSSDFYLNRAYQRVGTKYRNLSEGEWKKVISNSIEASRDEVRPEPKPEAQPVPVATPLPRSDIAELSFKTPNELEKAANRAEGKVARRLWRLTAREYLKADEPGKAANAYDRVAELTGGKEEKRYRISAARAYSDAGMPKEAGFSFFEAAKLAEEEGNIPEAIQYWVAAAKEYEKAGEFKAAAFGYEEAGKLAPWSGAENYLNLSTEFYLQAGKPRSAAFVLKKLSELSEGENRELARKYQTRAAECYIEASMPRAAGHAFRKATDLSKDRMEAEKSWILAIKCYIKAKAYAEIWDAQADIRRVGTEAAKRLWRLLAESYVALEDFHRAGQVYLRAAGLAGGEEAKQLLLASAENYEKADDRRMAANVYVRAAKYASGEEAKELYWSVVRNNVRVKLPKEGYAAVAEKHEKMGGFESAASAYIRAAKKSEGEERVGFWKSVAACFLKAGEMVEVGNQYFRRAGHAYKRAARLSRGEEARKNWRLAAEAYERSGSKNAARECLKYC